MPQRFSMRGSVICTGSAEVTEGCHMRLAECFAECATRISALLQEGCKGKGKTRTGRHRFATLCAVVLCCHCCPSQTATQTVKGQ